MHLSAHVLKVMRFLGKFFIFYIDVMLKKTVS